MRRLLGVPCLVVLLGAASACGREGEAPQDHAALVRTAKAGTGTITDWVRLYGRIVPPPDREADLAPQVAGILVEVPVREGQTVKAGSIVARVDTAPLDDAVRSAEAGLRRAEAEAAYRKSAADRTATLVDKGVASRQDAEADRAAAVSADAALAEATSELAVARRRREWATLHAPFDGVVMRVHRRDGDSVDGTPATPVVQVASNSGIQVAAEATAESLVRIKPRQPAEIEVGGSREGAFQARVLRVAQAVETATGSGEVRLVFEGGAPVLPLGLGVNVRVAVGGRPDATIVPARALRRGEGGVTEVVVVDKGKAAVRKVTTGLAEEDRIEVVSGLAPGETVVIDDPVGLADGMDLKERP